MNLMTDIKTWRGVIILNALTASGRTNHEEHDIDSRNRRTGP
jgi:hypothetical protein